MRIPLHDATDFGKRLLLALRVPEDIAEDTARHLVEADRVGYASHGLSILPSYCKVLEDDQVDPAGRPSVLTDHGNLLLFEGNRAWASTWAAWWWNRPRRAPSTRTCAS